MKKTIISLLLALTLCLGTACPALAADFDYDDDYDYTDPYYQYRGQDFVIRDGVLEKYIGDGGDVIIPDSVREIYSYAFKDCTNVTSVTLPGSLEKVGRCVFDGCTSLSKIVLPKDGEMVKKWESMDSEDFCESLICREDVMDTETIQDDDYSRTVYRHCNIVPLPAIEELVNCPNKMLEANMEMNESLLDSWLNPGQFVKPQSAQITALSNQICSGASSDYDKAKAIFEWLIANIVYDYDYLKRHKKEVAIYPEEVINSKLTICEGYSRLNQALLQAQGIPALYISGAAKTYGHWPRDNSANHAWNVFFMDGEWHYVDSTWGRVEYELSTGEKKIGYNLSRFDEYLLAFSRDHSGMEICDDPTAIHYVGADYTTSLDDTPSEWAQGETWEAICSKLAPNDLQAAYRSNITREEFCRLMVNLVEQKTGQSISAYLSSKGLTTSNPFSDTNSTEVIAAYALGIVNGKSAGSFDPSGPISRQEAAAMLTRTARLFGITSGTSESFADAGEFSPWASESIAFISGIKDPTTGSRVMGGTGSGNFSPWNNYTREQAIITALRLFHCA